MKRIIILLFFIALAVSTYAYSKGTAAFNVNYELITEPIAGVVYTPDSLGYHHLPINITYSGNLALASISLQTKNITWIKSMILGKDSLENVTINILSNETYDDTSWISDIKCTKELTNITNNTFVDKCVDNGYYFNFTNWRYAWNPLTSLSIQKNKWFVIDIIGYSPPSLDRAAVDIVPTIYGFSMPELAWWDINYANARNITFSITKTINRTFEPFTQCLTGITKLASNDDVRVVNAAVGAGGTEQPRDIINSTATDVCFQIIPNYTSTDAEHKWSVYYNYAGASAPSYSGTMTLTGNATQYNVTVTNQYKMVYQSNFRDGGVKFIYYANGTTLQQMDQFDDQNGANPTTLTSALNGTVMNRFWSNYSTTKAELYECYDKNFYCKIAYYANPSDNYYTVCPLSVTANMRWTAGAWAATGVLTPKDSWVIAYNNSAASIIGQMNITGWTNEACMRSNGGCWYSSVGDGCTLGTNSNRQYYLLFNLPYAANSTIDKLLDPMTSVLGAEQSSGTTSTSIREWLNGAENNLTITYGTSLNVTAKINVTGLAVSILKNGTVINTGTTTTTNITTWGVGYYNFTGNYSGNATHAASSQSYFLTVNQQPTSCSLTFSPTSNISYETQMKAICSCNNSVGTTNLYRNTTQINSLNNTLVTYGAGTYIYVCNLTSTQNYSSATSGGTFVVSKLNAALQAYPNTGFNYTGINTNQYCTGSSTISSLSFYRNSSSITNNTGIVFPVRGWNMTCNLADAINYTNYYSTALFAVAKAVSNASISFNTSSPAVIGTVINVSCYIPEPPTSYPDGLWNLSTNISNPYIWNTAGYAVGTYPFKCNQSGSENYSAFSTNSSMTLTATGALVISAVYDEENMSKSLTFNVEVFNSTYSVTSSGITSYNNNDVKGELTIILSSTGYGTRTYYATVPLTGSYTMSGYLLNASSGTNKVFYVKNYYEKYLTDVLFNITKLVGGNWTTMAMGITNDLGYSVFFLNSNGNYKFTLTKVAYDTKNITLVPIYDSYTIYMTTPTINVNPTTYNASYGNITYGLWLDKSTTNNSIRFNYNDMMNQTTNVSFRIYNSTNHSIYWTWNASNPTNFSKELPKPNTTYLAVINITHNIYGRINIVRSFDTSSTILPKPFSEDLFNQVMSVIAIIMVAMMFGAVEGATGGIIVMIVATIFVYWGWYSVSTIIMGIAWFYAILNKFMHRKVVK